MLSVTNKPFELSVIMMSIIMLSVVMLSVVMLNVVAPIKLHSSYARHQHSCSVVIRILALSPDDWC